MAITLRRQIDDSEKSIILKRFGRVCFATGHNIPKSDSLHFDHIKAFSAGGPSEINNIAPMCEKHNKEKGRLPLYDFRIRLIMTEFFSSGDNLTLNDELEFLLKKKMIKKYGDPVFINEQTDDHLKIEMGNKEYSIPVLICPITGWRYFYAQLPVEVIDSDDDKDGDIGLQPRYLIFDKVFTMFRHFQNNPVLQPSIGRIHKGRILLFDGQHKIASLLWGGHSRFGCKIYLDADPYLLNTTNISAHEKFAQTRFYSSIMVAKLGSQFGKAFEEYKISEDTVTKSESGFVTYLKERDQLSNADINKRFRSFLFNLVLDDERNKVSQLVSKGNRSTAAKPITIDMLQKSLFAHFLYKEPVVHDMGTEKYLREYEIENVIDLFNMLYDASLINWDAQRFRSDPIQNQLDRMYRSKSIMAWSAILHAACCAKLNKHLPEERAMPLYCILSDDNKAGIKFIIQRLVDWPMWASPPNSNIERVLSDNVSAVKEYFKENGLTTGYLLGAPE